MSDFNTYKLYFATPSYTRGGIRFYAANHEEAMMLGRNMVYDWFQKSVFKNENEKLEMWFTWHIDHIENGAKQVEGSIKQETFVSEIDHQYLIDRIGGNSYCEHEWIADTETEGGSEDRPGVFMVGEGNSWIYKKHCTKCCLSRTHIAVSVFDQLPPTGVRDTVFYGKIKYRLNADEVKELSELDEIGAFKEDFNEADWVMNQTYWELVEECKGLLNNCWNMIGYNPNKFITAPAMARYLKNRFS